MPVSLWMSGEVQADVADAYRSARQDVETEINAALRDRDYGSGLKSWTVIGILRAKDHPDYPEVKKYRKRERAFEFRLKIAHSVFKRADAIGQRTWVAETVLRSIREMGAMAIANIDYDQLENCVRLRIVAKGWAHP